MKSTSIWTFRAVLAGAALIALGACDLTFPVTRAAPERVSVADDSVIVAGPPGYCVDRAATRDTARGAFVLLGSCASLSGDADNPSPRVPAVLTVSVSGLPGDGAALDAPFARIDAFLRSEQGRRALSRTGDPATVEILDIRQASDALVIHARDTGAGEIAGIEDEYWRALLDVNGRMVTVSVTGFEARPMSPDAGRATVEALAERILRENAAPTVATRGRLPG